MECNPYIKLEVRGAVTRDERFYLDAIDTYVIENMVIELLAQVMERRQRVTLTFIRQCDACGDNYQLHMFEADSTDLARALDYVNRVAKGHSTPEMKVDVFAVQMAGQIVNDVINCLWYYEHTGSMRTRLFKQGIGKVPVYLSRINLAWSGHKN